MMYMGENQAFYYEGKPTLKAYVQNYYSSDSPIQQRFPMNLL